MRRFARCLLMGALIASDLSFAQDTVQVWVTVDWEGLSLQEENLEAIRRFRVQFPDIPLVHLVNPAYFIQPGVNRAQVGSLIRSTFLPEDTIGLHLHPLRALVEYCGVPYQSAPVLVSQLADCESQSCGYSVSLEYAYSQTELVQLVACSSALLQTNGFNRPRHFRAGAWQLGPKLQAALEANQFSWDSSRVDVSLLMPRWHADSPMIRTLMQLHPNNVVLAQPYALSTQLMEYPDNAALADYTSSKQLLSLFKQLLNTHKAVMVLGFHQETAADYLYHLQHAIPRMEKLAVQHQVKLEWMH